MTYTKADILKDFDSNGGADNPYKFFLTLEDAYTTVSSNKIHLYADKDRWAVVFEVNGYDNRGFCIRKTHSYFGNCLDNLEKAGLNDRYIVNMKYFLLCPEEDIMKIWKDFEEVLDTAKTIKIRNTEILIEHDLNVYKANNIPWQKYDTTKKSIDIPSMTRMLNFQHPEIFNSTEEELRTCIPKDLPKLMTIDEWYHVDCYQARGFESSIPLPSSIETFQLIAEVLVSKDIKRYKPTMKSNSHWSNWKSGNL
jgi:hypothetical protein